VRPSVTNHRGPDTNPTHRPDPTSRPPPEPTPARPQPALHGSPSCPFPHDAKTAGRYPRRAAPGPRRRGRFSRRRRARRRRVSCRETTVTDRAQRVPGGPGRTARFRAVGKPYRRALRVAKTGGGSRPPGVRCHSGSISGFRDVPARAALLGAARKPGAGHACAQAGAWGCGMGCRRGCPGMPSGAGAGV